MPDSSILQPLPKTPARARPWLSLRTRFLALVVLSVTLVALTVEYLGGRVTLKALEEQATTAAGVTALGVAEDLFDQATLPTAPELEQLLVNYKQLVPRLRSLSVLETRRKALVLIATTAPKPEGDLEGLAKRAIEKRAPFAETESRGEDALRLVAAPLERDGKAFGAVVVGISLSAVLRAHENIQRTQTLLVLLSTLLIALVVDFVGQRLVFAPLTELRSTIGSAFEGELGARVSVARADEIGDVSSAFNEMLSRIEGFSATLEAEVANATGRLAERNAELQASVEQLFQARHELAKGEMLAATGQMAATVAHRIGTPLALISGYVQLLRAEEEKGSERAERLRTIQEQIERVTQIVRELLDQTRKPLLRRQPIDAGTLLSNAARLARPTATQRGVSLLVDVAENEPLPLFADIGQMEQVFLNLATNALDATPRGGRITLRGRRNGDRVEFEVEDTGVGIPAGVKPRVFDALFTTKDPGRGTGLGLSIVRDVVTAHGGTVEVQSEEGQGARFLISLPARSAPENAADVDAA